MIALILFFLSISSAYGATQTAIFAGGCFWCMEPPYEKLIGVESAISGYIGGEKANPTYEEVSSGSSGHIEAIKITFDNTKISYDKLLDVFWKNIDPLDTKGQFCDKGEQYTSGIFYQSEEQEKSAKASLAKIKSKFKGKKVATFIREAKTFYDAEDYHQDYYKKNPVRYKFYRYNCGRDKRLEEVWGK